MAAFELRSLQRGLSLFMEHTLLSYPAARWMQYFNVNISDYYFSLSIPPSTSSSDVFILFYNKMCKYYSLLSSMLTMIRFLNGWIHVTRRHSACCHAHSSAWKPNSSLESSVEGRVLPIISRDIMCMSTMWQIFHTTHALTHTHCICVFFIIYRFFVGNLQGRIFLFNHSLNS